LKPGAVYFIEIHQVTRPEELAKAGGAIENAVKKYA